MAKPKFAMAKKPQITAEQAAFVEGGHGKDKAAKTVKTPKPPKIEGPTRRISIDVPLDVAIRFKAATALAGTEMADELREFIERRLAELEAKNRKTA